MVSFLRYLPSLVDVQKIKVVDREDIVHTVLKV